MDAEICRKSCDGMSPTQVVSKLKDVLPQVSLLSDGILIVAVGDFPSEGQVAEADTLIRKAIGLPPIVLE
jgi:hypothetical protein